MSTHTPGPWVVRNFAVNGETRSEVLDANGGNACIQSNAHLIAAAPAMYEALQWAMQYLRMPNFHPDNSYNSEQWARDYNKLTDALAQAEGR